MISVYLDGLSVKEFDAWCKSEFGSVPYFEVHDHDVYTGQHRFYNEVNVTDEDIELWFSRSEEGIVCVTSDANYKDHTHKFFIKCCLFVNG